MRISDWSSDVCSSDLVTQRGGWRYLVPFTFMASHAAIYEIIEWLAATWFGGDLGVAYLGTQGDVWDAQKDSALAILGALIAVLWVRAGEGRPSLRDAQGGSGSNQG